MAIKSKAKQPKTATLAIRITPEQRSMLDEAARREDLDTSTWLRQLGLRAAKATHSSPA